MKKTKEQETFCKQLLDQNITCELPEFEPIYSHVQPIVPALQDALDYGHQLALWVLSKSRKENRIKDEKQRRRINQNFYSHIMRWAAQMYLNTEGIKTRYEEIGEESNWDVKVLANNGLKGVWRSRSYRIFKGRNGQLPSLGISKVKQEFYKQDHLNKLALFPPDNKPKLYNVAFLWDIHPQNYVNLYLCCPRHWANHKVYDYFIRLLQHPAEVITPEFIEAEDIESGTSEIKIPVSNKVQERLI